MESEIEKISFLHTHLASRHWIPTTDDVNQSDSLQESRSFRPLTP